MALHGFHGVLRAGRHVAAGKGQHGRDCRFVPPQHLQRDEFGALLQDRRPASGARLPAALFAAEFETIFSTGFPASFCSMTSSARLTSLRTAAKSTDSSDFFGLMTTSAATPSDGTAMRTASRKRRFMRLRCTAPPSARPTVNPTRRPDDVGWLAPVTEAALASGRAK
jgi:hypothetical protein